MKILQIKPHNIHFKAGKSFLYSDFDGTFLPDSLRKVYEAPKDIRDRKIRELNSYFQDFQDFIDSSKGDFSINITTGRRFNKSSKSGFQPAYEKMKQEGVILPKINSVITSNGGDVHIFNSDGAINSVPEVKKALEVKEACGWDSAEVKKAIDDVSREMGVTYQHMRHSRNYKFSIFLNDSSRNEEFLLKLKQTLKGKMQISANNEHSHYPNEPAINGMKIQPSINGRHLKKDFDVRVALRKAIENNDFVIFAGNEDNDKEALNIFSYLKNPPNGKIPSSIEEIDNNYISSVKNEIDSLPLKILFIEPPIDTTNPKTLELAKFIKKQVNCFLKK